MFILAWKITGFMIDPERIQRLAAKLGSRDDALRLVRQMRCGGKKFDVGGPVSGWNPVLNVVSALKDRYLRDYANNGNILGYPESPGQLLEYAASPYREKVDESYPDYFYARRAALAKYLGVPDDELEFDPGKYVVKSEYRPTKEKDGSSEYYTYVVPEGKSLYDIYNLASGRIKLDVGSDERGSYVSLYDKWDVDPLSRMLSGRQGSKNGLGLLGAKPVEMYDRVYESDDPELFRELLNKATERVAAAKKFDGGGRYFRTNLRDESPMAYQPMMPVYPDVRTPMRYYPQPNYGDYEYPASTGMVQSMPIQVNVPVSAPMTGVLADEVSAPVSDLFSDEAKAKRRLMQRYVESKYDDNAGSPAGAKGPWQIMDITVKDYLGRGRGKQGNIYDPEYNGQIRDWVMSIIPRDLGEFWSDNDSDINKLAKLYAAYNWGAGNLKKFLRSRLDAGLSNDDPYEWVEAIKNKGKRPDETKNYVKFLALNQDIPDTYMTREKFEELSRERGYMASGGKIHIKPENRGKFTALKKRTGHSASWFKAHGTPAQKKMAVFALNARKWKHGDGGFINQYDGESEETGWLRRFLSTPTRVPNMTGTATAAATGLRDIPLMDSTVGKELAVAGAAMLPLTPYLGTQAALGIDTMGRYAMPSTFLKGVSYYAPKAAGALGAVSPWLDAGALSLWSAEAGKAALDAKRQGRTGDAIGMGALAALPIAMPLGMKAYQGLRNGLRMKPFEIGNVSSAELYDPIVGHSTAPPEAYFAEEAARENAEIARLGRETLLAEPVDRPVFHSMEWTPQELERLRAMAGDHPMNLDAYTPEQIAQAQAMMQADAPVIHDALAGNRSTAPTQTFLAAVPSVAKTTEAGYQIQRYPGYMLQSLMEGNALEKQMGKNGTVSVNNIKALMKSAKKVDQAVVDKVLASEEFAGKKSIDYNQFRKAVQDELITYDRTPDTRWSDYGMGRIGQGMDGSPNARKAVLDAKTHMDRFNAIDVYGTPAERSSVRNLTFDLREGKISESEYDEKFSSIYNRFSDRIVGNATPETFIFSSSRIPNGSAKHYDANTLGHSRTYTTADEPDVLHVMESQSDWAQGKPSELLKTHDIKSLADLDEEIAFQKANAGEGYKGVSWQDELSRLEAARPYVDPETSYLADNFTSRQIQENLRYAAEKGQKKMRYPTRETAAKIEGYPEREAYFNEKGEEIGKIKYEPQEVSEQRASLYTFGEEADKEIAELQSGVKKYDDLISAWQGIPPEDPLDELAMRDNKRRWESYCSYLKFESKTGSPDVRESIARRYNEEAELFEKKFGHKPNTDKDVAEIEEALRESDRMHSRLLKLSEGEAKLRPGITKKTVYDHEDILRKYTEFPKQYKKLYKNADVRIVTDPKGNTWYEVDVPENYLQQEWKYSTGGILGKANQIYSGDISKIRQAIQNARTRQKK